MDAKIHFTRPKGQFLKRCAQRLVSVLCALVLSGAPFSAFFAGDAFAAKYSKSSRAALSSAIKAVNINSAGAEELAKALKGVGMRTANSIVEYRKKHGKFAAVKDLVRVKGIGEKLLERNRSVIKLR